MIIKKASFLQSNTKIDKLPAANKPEYAFIGRSNVGKSSLINMLTNDEWYLVDLPGYGFAQRSKKDRAAWRVMLDDYIKNRKNLISMFVLVDSRIEPQKIDLEFISHLGEMQMPFGIIFTKIDKINNTTLEKNLEVYKAKLAEEWEELPPIFITSSEKEVGKDDVLNYIESLNQYDYGL